MKPCPEWEEKWLEIASGEFSPEADEAVGAHLARCAACSEAVAALRSRRSRIDAALNRLVREAEPTPEFAEGVLRAAAEYRPQGRFWAWSLAAAAVAFAFWIAGPSPEPEADGASLLGWQSPTAALLRSPAETLLQSLPRLGESYGDLDVTQTEHEQGVVP